MRRLVDRLNTPIIVIAVLALVLAVNGLLFYRYQEMPAGPVSSSVETRPAGATATGERGPEERGPEEPAAGEAPERADRPPPSIVPAETDASAPERPEPEEPAPARPAPVEPVGFEEFMAGCDREGEECAREFVAETAPDARYIGGRTDLDVAGEAGRSRAVFYFEDPALSECEHEIQEHEAEDGPAYAVIVVGSGSFYNGRGARCIPEL